MKRSINDFSDILNKSRDYWQTKISKDKSDIYSRNEVSDHRHVSYELNQPLIVTQTLIFTIKEYFAAKKIFKLLLNNHRKNEIIQTQFTPIAYTKYENSNLNTDISICSDK